MKIVGGGGGDTLKGNQQWSNLLWHCQKLPCQHRNFHLPQTEHHPHGTPRGACAQWLA